MKLYWLSAIPLGVGVPLCMLRGLTAGSSRRRRYVVGVSLLTSVVCAVLALRPGYDGVDSVLGQQWALSRLAQVLLLFLFLVAALLIVVSDGMREAESFCGPALTSLGLLSAVIFLAPQPLSFILLPAALVVLTLAAPAAQPAIRGASRFLALVTLPIPFVLVCFALLDRMTLFPNDLAPAQVAGLLVIACVTLWLTLFPFHGTTRLWAQRQVPLAPPFLWVAKDWVVVYLLFSLWSRFPALRTESAAALLGMLGLATSVVSGMWACLQSDPSSLLACAALTELGMVAQGLALNSSDSLRGALTLLIGRSIAVLLATSALAVLPPLTNSPGADPRERGELPRSFALLSLVAFSVGILSMAGLPPLTGFLGRRLLYADIRAQNPAVLWAWLPASLGLVLGLARSGWSLWHSARFPQARRGFWWPAEGAPNLPALLVTVLLLSCLLWLGFHPQPMLRFILDVAAPWMPSPAL